MYEKYYQEYCNELHVAFGSYLYWKMFQNRSASEPKLLIALNETPLSWIMTRHALQVTFFMTLGRIFDINNDSFSVDDLLRCCIEEIDIFSKENLRIRKMKDKNGVEPDWLNGYISNAHIPTKEEFQKLRGELSKHRKVFEDVYRPIRHKLFAHKVKEFIGKSDQLWAKTNIGQLEKILWFLNDLKETFFDVYNNGRAPTLQNREPDLNFYENDYAELFDKIKKT